MCAQICVWFAGFADLRRPCPQALNVWNCGFFRSVPRMGRKRLRRLCKGLRWVRVLRGAIWLHGEAQMTENGKDNPEGRSAKGGDEKEVLSTLTPQELDARLKQLGSSLDRYHGDRADEEKKKGLADNSGMAYGLKIGAEFVSAVLVGGMIGWVLDRWLGTIPFGLIVFLMLGFAAGVLNVMRATGKVSDPGAKKR